jgi:hypothetical protein
MLRWFAAPQNKVGALWTLFLTAILRWFAILHKKVDALWTFFLIAIRRWFTKIGALGTRFLAPMLRHKWEVAAFGALFLPVVFVVWLLHFADNRLFSNEQSFQFDTYKEFLEWYKKALDSYQTAAPLFSAWAAACIVVGYTLVIKDLKKTDRYLWLAIIAFAMLALLSIFDLYLSQAYFSYYTYVFVHDYPVFEHTLSRHIAVQKYVHLLMLVNVIFLAGVALIRKLK